MPLSQEQQDAIWGKKGVSLSGGELVSDKYSILEPEEKIIISECQDEAFWIRSLPLSLSFAFGTHILHEKGVLDVFHYVSRPVTKIGLILIGSVAGFGLGQLSYSNICRDKFLSRCPDGVVATDIRMKKGIQTVPYSIFSPINQLSWRQLAKQREISRLHDSIDPGFQVDDEFKDQNILSPNLLNDENIKHQVGPVRYGVFKKEENVSQNLPDDEVD